MPTNETHKLTTISDLFRVVTMDNMNALATDIRGMLVNVAATKAMLAAAGGGDDELANCITSIDWTDDAVNRQTIHVPCAKGKSLDFVTKGKSK